MIVVVKLILAHLIGDFYLQPQSWVMQKEALKLKSGKLYLHCAIHGLLAMIVLFDFSLWYLALAIACAHFSIDALKLSFQEDKSKRHWFMIDQVLHVVSIILLVAVAKGLSMDISVIHNEKVLIYVTALVLLTQPASIAIKTFISRWAPETGENVDESLADAGKYIGILERLFVFVFIVLGHFEAVGFLIAAKSVFRFGDLRESKDRKLTEYILIGTLVSFGVAIAIGIMAGEFAKRV